MLAGQLHEDARLADDWAGRLSGPTNLIELTWFPSEGPYGDWVAGHATIFALCGAAYLFGHPVGASKVPRGHPTQMIAGPRPFWPAWRHLPAAQSQPDLGQCLRGGDVPDRDAGNITVCPRNTVARFGVNRHFPTYPTSNLSNHGWLGGRHRAHPASVVIIVLSPRGRSNAQPNPGWLLAPTA